jgi:putative lipoic acid-binding regulatory protein
MSRKKPLLKFPTEFPIKVMGRHDSNLLALTQSIVERHAGALDVERIRHRASSDGNLLAITFMVTARSQIQLDGIYKELTACDAVLMAL